MKLLSLGLVASLALGLPAIGFGQSASTSPSGTMQSQGRLSTGHCGVARR